MAGICRESELLMKKLIKILFVLVFIAMQCPWLLSLTDETNVLGSIRKATQNTFENPVGFFDGVIDSDQNYSASVTLSRDKIQQIAVELPRPIYMGTAKVYFDLKNYNENFQLQYTLDGRSWLNLTLKRISSDQKSHIMEFDGKGLATKALRLIYPPQEKGNLDFIRIQEIELFPSTKIRNSLNSTKIYALTDSEFIIDLTSSIDGFKSLSLINNPGPNQTTLNAQTFSPYDAVAVFNLKPDSTYVYTGQITDFNQNIQTFQPAYVSTKSKNLAFQKKVTGTFEFLSAPDNRTSNLNYNQNITDGSYDVFKGMARSGALSENDQFFVIDLQSVQKISAIVFYWDALAYPQNFEIQISDNNVDWRKAAQNINAADGISARLPAGGLYGPAQVHTVSLPDNLNARYVKVFIPQSAAFYHRHSNWQFVRIYECKIF